MSDYGPTPAVATPQPLYARYIHGGHTVDFTPLAATDYGAGVGGGVPFGGVVVIGSMLGFCVTPIEAAKQGALVIEGTFDLPKAASDGGMAAGSLWYWDDNNHVATGTSSGNTYGGKVEIAAATADTTVRVSLESIANGTGSGFGSIPIAAVAAAGTGQSDGGTLSVGQNNVTAADGTKCVVLPAAAAGRCVIVKNTVAGYPLPVYPASGDKINGGSADAVMANPIPGGGMVIFVAKDATDWYAAMPNNMTFTPGASTAAAGSTTADAGVLPAGTSSIYPTTAADDTKGVRIHAADKVDGRTLFIGNGVANKILKVYAPSGGAINGASADAAFSSASGKGVLITCLSASGNTWLAA